MPASTTRGASGSPPATGSAPTSSTRPRCIPISWASCMPLFGHDLVALRVLQALLGALSCALVAFAASRLVSRPAGAVAGFALAFYAPAIFFDGLVQKSVLDGAVRVGRAWRWWPCWTRARRRGIPAGWHSAWSTACLALTRENALVLAPVAAAWAWTRVGGRSSERATAAALVIAGTLLGLVAGGHPQLRGRRRAVSDDLAAGPELLHRQQPHGRRHVSAAAVRTRRGRVRAPGCVRRSPSARRAGSSNPNEVSRYWLGRALDFIASDPVAWLRLMGRKTALFLNRAEMLDTEAQEAHAAWSWPLALLQPVTHFGILLPLAVLGVWATWPERRRFWILWAMAATYAASTIAFYVFARYRYPLVPILHGVRRGRRRASAAVVVHGAPRWRRRRSRRWRRTGRCCRRPRCAPSPKRTSASRCSRAAGTAEAQAQVSRRARHRTPTHAPAYNNLGVALRSQGQLAEAIAVYEDGLRRRGDYPDLHYNLGNALSRGRAPRRGRDGAPARDGVAAGLGGGASQPRQRAGVAGPSARRVGALAPCRGAGAATIRGSRTTWARCCSREDGTRGRRRARRGRAARSERTPPRTTTWGSRSARWDACDEARRAVRTRRSRCSLVSRTRAGTSTSLEVPAPADRLKLTTSRSSAEPEHAALHDAVRRQIRRGQRVGRHVADDRVRVVDVEHLERRQHA